MKSTISALALTLLAGCVSGQQPAQIEGLTGIRVREPQIEYRVIEGLIGLSTKPEEGMPLPPAATIEGLNGIRVNELNSEYNAQPSY